MVFTVDVRAGKAAVAVQTRREMSLTSFECTGTEDDLQLCILVLLVPKMVLILCNLHWCSFVYAHIQMSTFCNFHCVVVVVCGGDFSHVAFYVVCVCACASVHVTVCSDCDVRVVWVERDKMAD